MLPLKSLHIKANGIFVFFIFLYFTTTLSKGLTHTHVITFPSLKMHQLPQYYQPQLMSFHSLNFFSHMIYMLQLANFWLTLVLLIIIIKENMSYNLHSLVISWVLIKIKLLKWIDQFIYLSSNISTTKSDINIHIGKAWTAIDRLSTI